MTGNSPRSSAHKKRFSADPWLLIIIVLLSVYGLVVLYSATRYIDVKEHPGSPFYTVSRQAVFLSAAFLAMAAAASVDYHRFLRFAGAGYLLAAALGILVLFAGKEVNGQKRWFELGPLSFQPAEFAKLMLIITLTDMFHRHYHESHKLSLIVRAVLITLPVFIPVVSANLSSGLIIAGIAFFMTFIASDRRTLFIAAAAAAAAAAVAAFRSGLLEMLLDEYQMNRIYAWMDPEQFPLSNGFQVLQGLYAIGAGGIFGAGFGQSLQKLGFLPEVQNDMIFSVICEESGLFGAVVLIILFILLIWRMMIIAASAADDIGMMLTAGVIIQIGIQVLLNIAVVTNTVPNTGISLPFISYGGSSILFLLTEMGIVLRVSSASNQAK